VFALDDHNVMRFAADESATMKQTVVDAQEHPIEAVTLGNYRAEVKRVITLELKVCRLTTNLGIHI
jgi:hypothetical protein